MDSGSSGGLLPQGSRLAAGLGHPGRNRPRRLLGKLVRQVYLCIPLPALKCALETTAPSTFIFGPKGQGSWRAAGEWAEARLIGRLCAQWHPPPSAPCWSPQDRTDRAGTDRWAGLCQHRHGFLPKDTVTLAALSSQNTHPRCLGGSSTAWP